MDKASLDFFLKDNITLDTSSFVANLFVAALLSVIIQIFYLKYSTTLSSKFEFSKNFVILGLTTAIIITTMSITTMAVTNYAYNNYGYNNRCYNKYC